MSEQQRIRILLAILGASLAFVVVSPLVDGYVFEPIRDRERRLANLDEQILAKKEEANDVILARSLLDDVVVRSLPSDPLDAKRLYRQWLHDLAQQSGWTQLEVLPGIDRAAKARDGVKYYRVQVAITGETTLGDLSTFLHRFERTDLTHRVQRLTVNSRGNAGNPVMEVTLTAEGVAMQDAGNRADLFPRTTLTADLNDRTSAVTVTDVESFPSAPPFLVRVGTEHLSVVSVDGNTWTVGRAADGTEAQSHPRDQAVELVPLHPDRIDLTPEDYANLLASSPFVKPQPPVNYTPRLESIPDRILTRGAPLKFPILASGLDPRFGRPRYRLVGKPQTGMTLDMQSGEFVWEANAEQPLGVYDVTVSVTLPRNPELDLRSTFKVNLREPNTAPTLELQERYTAWVGQEISIRPVAADDGPLDALTWSLADGAPEGTTIEAQGGEFRWTPAASLSPGQFEVSIVVTDTGEPPLNATGKILIDAQEDSASFTYLTGSVAADDKWKGLLYDRSTNRETVVRVGSRLQVSNIEAVIVEIGRRHVLIDSRGSRWRWKLGENLRSLVRLEPLDAQPVATPGPESAEARGTDTSPTDDGAPNQDSDGT